MDKTINTPQEEVKEPGTAVDQSEAKVETPKAEEKSSKTIGETLKTGETKAKPETVPLSEFLEMKKSNKELSKQIKELQKSIEEGATKEDVSDDVDTIAEEFNVDKKFLKKLTNQIKSNLEKDVEERLSSKLKPIEEKDKEEKIDKVFNKHFTDTMADMPEYKDVVNKDVIKTLALDPKNANKTFAQLVEETYSRSLRGKGKTIEETTPRGGKEPEEVDFDKANRDEKYFNEVMDNPELKKKYNETLMKRIRL